ncbi:MAG TPA: efflux RND transporter periplasmic adaptor subunit [Myxococcaceae bacterium]|jgi:RND family efflux transporter MFP subunit
MLAAALLAVPGSALAAPPRNAPTAATAIPADWLVGVVVAHHALDLTAQAEGRLEKLEVRLGDRVQAGQVLAVLELAPLQMEVNARQATLQAADAELRRAQVLLQQAQQRLEREKRISHLTAAEALETAQTELELASVNVDLAKARRAETEARLEQARKNLEYAHIRAPFTGRITERYQSLGSMVGRATPLFRMVSDELRLRFAVPETRTATVRPGAPVQVRLPALGVTLEGKVESLAPEVDTASRHQKAEARLTIPEPLRSRVAVGLLAEVMPEPAGVATSSP